MRKLKVHVRINELHTQPLDVPPWEVPLLAVIHGENEIEVQGEMFDDQPVPSAEDEYERLHRRYGAHSETPEQPYVVAVYGAHGAGIRALANEIRASQGTDDAAETTPTDPAGDAETVMQTLEQRNRDDAVALVRRLDQLETLRVVADEERGDHRSTVRQAAFDRIAQLERPQAAG